MALVVAATIVAYLPALNGAPLWDDDAHLTKPELQSWNGLWRIWTEPSATQQYYPLLHTAFWVEQRLWGDSVIGYHTVTLLWHLLAVLLLYSILRKLNVRGRLLATAIFALHPVMVESVAWISEQKNTLSAVFYLAAMRVYLSFDDSRTTARYALALTLFALGLLTKTVTATLPAALLVIFWWQRGKIEWRRDVQPLLPFFALGAIAGVFTAWIEYTLIGARGEEFRLSFLDRTLLAGRVPWFYLSKLLVPINLAFIYPRWEINANVWWQWFFPLATLAVFVGLWKLRHWSRGPLAAWLLFVGTLAPVLGFLNVYPFLFSYVADHFQYLASISIIVLASAGLTLAATQTPRPLRPALPIVGTLLLAACGYLTFRQSGMYADSIRLYTTTIALNPECWMAHYNLANTLMEANDQDRAVQHFRHAIRIRPTALDARVNLGVALKNAGRLREAADVYRETAALFPNASEPLSNLGAVLSEMGQYPDALDAYHAVLELRPNDAQTLNSIALALMQQNRFVEARQFIDRALELDPDLPAAYDNMGLLLIHFGKISDAIQQFQASLRIEPRNFSAHNNLGLLYASLNDTANSIHHFEAAVRIQPDSAQAHNNLAELLRQTGRPQEAVDHYEAAIALSPSFPQPYMNLARAFAVLGRNQDAVTIAEKGIAVATEANDATAVAALDTWLTHYRIELERDDETKTETRSP